MIGAVLYLLGSVFGFVGLLNLDNGLPGEETSVGAVFVIFLGGAAASLGAALVAIAIIGWGVKLGREAAELSWQRRA